MILSGVASDGTAGLKAIKAQGGITFAQQPESARFDGMPRSAIAAGCVDLVLPPERIAAELARIAGHHLRTPMGPSSPEAVPALAPADENWARVFGLLRTACAVDFTFYKKSTISRRLARRMAKHKIDSISEYLNFLEGNRREIDALFHDFLINVTGFFREPEVFDALREKIFPKILAGKAPGEAVRIWVPGCSSGEEAYSIAICLLEYLGDRAAGTPIQIFGTDISNTALQRARAGIYPEHELREVSPQRLRRFLTRIKGNYGVNAAVRELCVFARHDVTKDAPFSRLDLISCRNVLIYFEPALQKKVLTFFHYALKSTGVLLLGKAAIPGFSDLFTITDRRHKFFVKNTTANVRFAVIEATAENLAARSKQIRQAPPGPDLEKEADRIIWERYHHAGLVVNDDLQILHLRGDTSPYLQPVPGQASLHLLRMVPKELQLVLRAAIHKARKSGGSVRRDAIAVKRDGQVREVNIEVCPLTAFGPDRKSFLILFERVDFIAIPHRNPSALSAPAKEPGSRSALVAG